MIQLTENQALFVAFRENHTAYLTDAYQSVYPDCSRDSARTSGSRMSRLPQVEKAMDEINKKKDKDFEIEMIKRWG